MRIATWSVLGLTAIFLLAGCGGPPREFRDVAEGPEVVVDLPPAGPAAAGDAGVDAGAGEDQGGGFVPIAFGLAAVPAMPLSQLLGMARSDIETLLRPVGADDEEKAAGWVRYSLHLRVRYEGDTAVELVQKVPAGLSCAAAASWIGFGGAGEAVEAGGRCEWPGGDSALAEGVAGELDRAGCQFTARRPLPAPAPPR